jgi:hypothetical protein
MRAKSTARRRAAAIASALLFFAAVPSARAQPVHTWQASAGYSALRVPNDNVNFTAGWDASTSVLLTRWLSIVADVDGHSSKIPSFGTDITLTSHGFSAGARASAKLGAFTEFGQVLVGGVRSTGTVFATADTTSHFIFQPGIGLDYPLSPRWAARAELDARWLATGQQIRGVAALVYWIN